MGNGNNHSTNEFELQDSELMVLCTDAQARVVYANPPYQRAMGYTTQELRAIPVAERLRDMPPQVAIDAGITLRGGKPWYLGGSFGLALLADVALLPTAATFGLRPRFLPSYASMSAVVNPCFSISARMFASALDVSFTRNASACF